MLAMMVDLEEDEEWAMADELEDDDFDRYVQHRPQESSYTEKTQSDQTSLMNHTIWPTTSNGPFSLLIFFTTVMQLQGRVPWIELPVGLVAKLCSL